MRDELLEYYERELNFLRRTGSEFARRYPKVASRLLLEPTKSDDPHVERLLEGVAFLAARVHLKLDDEFPEVPQALLNVLYPEYDRPLPSMSLVEFQLDPEQGKLTSGLEIPKETLLYSRPVAGSPCRFRTCYDLTLWPIQVADAGWVAPHQLSPPIRASEAVGALRIELRCAPDLTFDQLELDRLRLHLAAEPNISATLYELLCNSCSRVLVRGRGARAPEPVALPPSAIRPVGFAREEGMFPTPRRSFVGYRLLAEYFAFPEKFLFLDVEGLERLHGAGFGQSIELVFLISSFERAERRDALETGVNAEAVRLGCTPVINLFQRTSEPILVTQRQPEYPVVADARRRDATAVYSVDRVVAVNTRTSEAVPYKPLYSHNHVSAAEDGGLYWFATRRPRGWRADEGTDVYLSFVDGQSHPLEPDVDAVSATLTCFNGALPSQLRFGDPEGDFDLQGGGPIKRIVALTNPTPMIQPPLGRPLLWKLVSLFSLNYVSLVEGGPAALQELLRLHNFGGSASGEQQIGSILELSSEPVHSRIESEHGLTFARGHRVDVLFDEEQFAGGGAYLLASVLERFLGLYTSLNSFSILRARTRQRKAPLREWAPRAGWKALL